MLLATAQLHWESSGFSTALPLLLQASALSRQHHLQSLASEAVLHLAFTQVSATATRRHGGAAQHALIVHVVTDGLSLCS